MSFQDTIEKIVSEVLLHCIMLSIIFFIALLWASTEVNEQRFNHNGFVLIGQTFIQQQTYAGQTTRQRFNGGPRRPTVNNATETNGPGDEEEDDANGGFGATGNDATETNDSNQNAKNNDDDDANGGSGATGNDATETNDSNQNAKNNDDDDDANGGSGATGNDATETNDSNQNAKNNDDDDDANGGSGATGNGTTETNDSNQNSNNDSGDGNADSKDTGNNATETNDSNQNAKNNDDDDDDANGGSGATGNDATETNDSNQNAKNNDDDDDANGGSGATGNGTTETNDSNQNSNNDSGDGNADSKDTGNDATETNESNQNIKSNDSGHSIKIKLLFTDESIRLVNANLLEKIIDFKRKLFASEIAANKIIRLIFHGRVLMNESTVKSNGLHNDCTVHCIIHNPPPHEINPQQLNFILNSMELPIARQLSPPPSITFAEFYRQCCFDILSVLKVALMSTVVYMSVIYFFKPNESFSSSLINSITLTFYVLSFTPMVVWITNFDEIHFSNNNNQ